MKYGNVGTAFGLYGLGKKKMKIRAQNPGNDKINVTQMMR